MNLIEKITSSPESILFPEVIAYIDEHYAFTPTRFTNGKTTNEANQNNGSCKIFAFAQLMDLDKKSTLQLFGEYYREEVLQNPEGSDHQNIRNFMEHGWEGIHFEGNPLTKK
ncbi:HopJ type III effector protein [Algoriphagus sp. CAU 1675]|uniref:HopJ type III effector protein n=1 Tax=Algoriphagus sp. CAU 1675 TaxID=3032597 RepID=UPI0023D9D8C1|nr:HopJ type III effector protein [Algoriphagus sp. CAU 1675]MDF2156912.1 HopJ type III effector protein [Algoriphagus sp. CAU 1675]